MKLALYLFPDSRERFPREVLKVEKTRGAFTGATVWRVTYKEPLSGMGYSDTLYHGKLRNLPPEKVTVFA
jgi:hypothetical protein